MGYVHQAQELGAKITTTESSRVATFVAEVLSWHRPLAVPKDLVCQCSPEMRWTSDPVVLCACGVLRCGERERATRMGPLVYASELVGRHYPERAGLRGCSECGRPHFAATRCVGCTTPAAGLCPTSRGARAAGMLPPLPEEVFHAQHGVRLA